MTILLVFIGIVLIPFFTIPGADSRLPKEILGLGLALSIVLSAIFQGQLKPFRNYWLLLFIFFSYLCVVFSPPFRQVAMAYITKDSIEIIRNMPVANLWMFKALFYITIYSLMIIVLASVDWYKYQFKDVIFLMALCGFLMSLYVISFQLTNLDQFFSKVSMAFNPDVNRLDKPLIGGFMGQATVVAPFIAMTIPLALYLRKYIWVLCMAVTVYLTMSKMAIIAVPVGLIIYFFFSERRFYKSIGIVSIALILCLLTFFINAEEIYNKQDLTNYVMSSASGRTAAWKLFWENFSTEFDGSKRTFFGIGPGSFRYFSSIINKHRFWQAHCDPFEVMINFGIPGLAIVFMGFKHRIKRLIGVKGEILVAISTSLLILGITSFGTFSFQITPNIFYAVILVGLLHNTNILKEVNNV